MVNQDAPNDLWIQFFVLSDLENGDAGTMGGEDAFVARDDGGGGSDECLDEC